MSASQSYATPSKDAFHEGLALFLGEWTAEGSSFGGPDQSAEQPRARPQPWRSTHTGRWHTGGFFLVQDERAVMPDGQPFDTLSVMGRDHETGRTFARTFENHGFCRDYDLAVEGRIWTISGATERARITFSEDGRKQTITWEWKRGSTWLPLCDRVATRMD